MTPPEANDPALDPILEDMKALAPGLRRLMERYAPEGRGPFQLSLMIAREPDGSISVFDMQLVPPAEVIEFGRRSSR